MTIVYATCIWNHYQGPFGYEMAKRLGNDFQFVVVRPMDDPDSLPRIKLGWDINPPQESWIIPNPATMDELADVNGPWIKSIETADVAVLAALHGCRNLHVAVRRRILHGKLTFFVNERFFKQELALRDKWNPANWYRWSKLHFKFNLPNVHYLPISHFGRDDMKFLRACKGRIWQWAYFPQLSERPITKTPSDKLKIGWCGRMIAWKHVEYAIEAMALLPESVRKNCELTIVGRGECETIWRKRVMDLGLTDCIVFKPPMTIPEVTVFMTNLDVYVFPSDRGEGWGVVLAEAMDKCCVPIACEEAGATLSLVKDGVSGYVFKKGDVKAIADKIECLYDHRDQMAEMGYAAWKSVHQWSADIAADRLINLIGNVCSGNQRDTDYTGLCERVG